ncbi:MAG TPA: Crp/Fnr family transcriptional regulator [Paludibacteraceae bacterium]|nr:Crp/Fnr family transcriptional regulator [Paludibacteraceae bacterium]HON02611.1 Crp/Fnr family transcriptional regulator [Paludibacteraceae bacterium]HPD59621.1 Crp/Fnr family transcriptional regulator [Paludibacteraceae bacterium]HRS24245.1 Crp/Fnr family transcriptional regulator [Paludibacteraceae bacterium]
MKSIDPEWKSYGSIDDGESGFPADLKYSIKPYRKNEIMFRQGSICDALYILTSGSVKTEMITETGNIMGIELIKAPRPLAPAFLFSDNNRFPVDVTALEDCEILRIPKEEVMRLMAIQPDFMQQFLKHNANRAEFLANRLQLLSIKTIKGRIAHFLLEQMAEYGKTFTINRNRTELAEFFGVARPSLARSLSEMVEDNIIKINKKQFTVIDERKLKDLLL